MKRVIKTKMEFVKKEISMNAVFEFIFQGTFLMSNINISGWRLIFFPLPPSVSGYPLANGKMHLHSSVKRKLAEEKCYVFDKRLRYNVRQHESNCRFRDIVVRKEEGFTHVLLSSQTTDNNALTPEVRRKVCMYKMFVPLSTLPTFNYVTVWLHFRCDGAHKLYSVKTSPI